ncbi:MAG TPA: cytochrome ubiquinol oxidase subunit I [Hyphomicrobium sp.]
MDVDAILLARIQFAFTITFHIIFPSFTIGLAAFIATLLVRWRMTGEDRFHTLARFWTKIFAVSFAMGVVSGIVLSYQIGTNWAKFSVVAGNIIGPLLGYEVLTAFFLEATFLGIMLFGWHRVSPNLHTLSAILVAVGTSFSAFWILAANSWMQTPAGFEMKDGIAYPVSWFHIIFNPSFPYRFAHMFTAAYLTTSLVVLSVGARYLCSKRFVEEAKTMIRMGLGMVAILAPLQLLIGDQHGLNTAEYQPVKLAAMEAHWDGSKPAELVLFAWPDAKTESNHFEVGIPHLGSLIIKHDPDGLFKGLKDFKPSERPALLPIFFAFRAMVGIGLLLIAIGFVGAFLWWRRKLFDATWYLQPLTYAWPLGFIAIISGWWVTETGRQPYLVYGILRTVDAASPVSFGAVLTSLILFVLIYTSVFSMGILYINKLIEKGPQGKAISPDSDPDASAGARPLAAAQGAARSALGSKE